MSRMRGVAGGILLCIFGLAACYYSIQTARSQALYYTIKYSDDADKLPLSEVADIADKAHHIYPYNYELSSYICSHYLASVRDVSTTNDETYVVARWCQRGLEQNPYPRILRYTKALLLLRDSPAAAAEYWQGFCQWQFWSSRNLAILVEFYVAAGRLAEAGEIVDLLKGHPDYTKAAGVLRRAWAAEMRMP